MIVETFTSWDHIAAADVDTLYGDRVFTTRPKWSGTVGSMVAGYSGGQAISAPAALLYTLSTPFEACIVRVRIKPTALTVERLVCQISSGTTIQIEMFLTTLGRLRVKTQAGGNVDITSLAHTALVIGNWYSIEFGVYIHQTDGKVRVRLDGNDLSDLHLDGKDTQSHATIGTFSRIKLDNPDGIFDDFVLKVGTTSSLDVSIGSDGLGNPRIATLLPNGKGSYEGWTRVTGSGDHYAELDETTGDALTSYLQAGNGDTDKKESWQFQDIAPVGSISAPLPTSSPVVSNHPGTHASGEWEDYFAVKPVFSRGNYLYRESSAFDDFTLLSAGRLEAKLVVTGSNGPRRSQISRWDPTKSAQVAVRHQIGDMRFYSMGLEIPSNWTISKHKTVVLQWHDTVSAFGTSPNPPLSVEVVGTEFLVVQVVGSTRRRLATIPNVIGKTWRWTLQAKWFNTSSGFLRMWLNEAPLFTQTGVANLPASDSEIHVDLGVYMPGVPNGNYPVGFTRKAVYNYYLVGTSTSTANPDAPPPIAEPLPQPPTAVETAGAPGIIDVQTVFQIRRGLQDLKATHFFRLGGADFESISDSLPGGANTWAYMAKRWPVSPLTGRPWASYELNGAECGVKRASSIGLGNMDISQGAVVVLYNDTVTNVEVVGATTLLNHRTHHLCSLWNIRRKDGVNFYFTDHNAALVRDGNTYTPAGAGDSSARRKEAYLREPNFEYKGAITSDQITIGDLKSGKFRDAKVIEQVVDWRVPWAAAVETYIYWMGEARYDRNKWFIEMSGIANRLRHKVGSIYSRVCKYDLGDARCKVPLINITKFGIRATDIQQAKTVFRLYDFEVGIGTPDDFYTFGMLTFVTGANKDLTFEVKDYIGATFEIVLQLPTPYPIVGEDRMNLEPGCNHLFLGDCKTKYNNQLNFGGFPYIPGTDRAIQTPKRR